MTKFPVKRYSPKTVPSRYSQGQKLSPAEKRIYNLIVLEGLNATEIANRICRTESTVKFHISVIYQKKGVRRVSHLIIKHYQTVMEAA